MGFWAISHCKMYLVQLLRLFRWKNMLGDSRACRGIMNSSFTLVIKKKGIMLREAYAVTLAALYNILKWLKYPYSCNPTYSKYSRSFIVPFASTWTHFHGQQFNLPSKRWRKFKFSIRFQIPYASSEINRFFKFL